MTENFFGINSFKSTYPLRGQQSQIKLQASRQTEIVSPPTDTLAETSIRPRTPALLDPTAYVPVSDGSSNRVDQINNGPRWCGMNE